MYISTYFVYWEIYTHILFVCTQIWEIINFPGGDLLTGNAHTPKAITTKAYVSIFGGMDIYTYICMYMFYRLNGFCYDTRK